MMAALDNFRRIEAPHKMAILGAMKELGDASREEHQKVVDYLSRCHFERVCLVGEEFADFTHPFEQYKDVKEVEVMLSETKPEHCLILIKGSNSMKLSQLQDYL